MGVYNNNKDGTRSTIANTIQVVDAPMEQFVSRGEFSAVTPNDVSADNKLVAENEVTKAVDTMPTASASLVGTIVQYVGTTTVNYTNGYFYKCVSDGAITPTYSWVEVIGVRYKYNVQDYGVLPATNDDDTGATATTALQTLINTVPAGSILYFPAGVYKINAGITFNKRIAFVGEDTTIKTWTTTSRKDAPISQIQATDTFPANTTMFTRVGTPVCVFRNLGFFAHTNPTNGGMGESFFQKHDNDDVFSSFPYPHYKITTPIVAGVNGIDANGAGQFEISNCYFYGFSGYALKVNQHRFIDNCGFCSCNIGIDITYTDSWISNCWFRSGNTAILTEGLSNILLNVSDTWADQMAGNFIRAENQPTDTSVHAKIVLLLSNVWVDMIDQAAIYSIGELYESMIDGRFSRCGMTYAGAVNSDWTYEISPYSDVICAWRITNSEINVSIPKKAIDVSEAKYNRVCPLKLLGRTTTSGKIDMSKIICPNLKFADILKTQSSSVYEIPMPDNGVSMVDTDVICEDGIFKPSGVHPFYYQRISARKSSPLGRLVPSYKNDIVLDSVTGMVYRATGTSANTDWKTDMIIKVNSLPAASANELGNMYQYVGATNAGEMLFHGAVYECVYSNNEYTWAIQVFSTEAWTYIVSQCNDFSDFKAFFENL